MHRPYVEVDARRSQSHLSLFAAPFPARWIADTTARLRPDMALAVIELAHVDLPAVYPAVNSAVVDAYLEQIDRADAFIVITPEYNHGYPASLKQAIDLPMQRRAAARAGGSGGRGQDDAR